MEGALLTFNDVAVVSIVRITEIGVVALKSLVRFGIAVKALPGKIIMHAVVALDLEAHPRDTVEKH